MKLIDRLTVGQRLLIMTLIFLIPAGIMLWLISASIQKDIDFAVYERYGNAYQRPIQQILEAMTPYAWARVDNADKSISESLIDKGFEKLTAVQKTYGEKLQVTPQGLASRQRDAYAPEKLLARWNELKGAKDFKNADLVALANDIKGLLSHTGDTSNLILDPDLDSYYLMDVTLCALPQTQNRLMTTQFDTNDLLVKNTATTPLTSDEKIKNAVNSAMFSDSDRGRVAGDIDTVFKEDKNFYGVSPTLQPSLAPALDSYAKSSQALEAALSTLAQGGSVAHADYLKLVNEFNTQSFAFWNKGVDELDILLTKRIQSYQNKCTLYVITALVALGLAVLLALYLSGTIRRVLKNIMDILSKNATLLAQAGSQMQDQAHQVATAAHEQVSSIEKTAAFMEEITSIIKQNEDFSKQSRDNAVKALVSANESKQNTEELHKSTLAVDTVLEQMQKAMSDIRASSESIAHILRTIDEIAFQTNILALNAAVEAARAGEAGAGFSVVADEVRKLAHRSATAAEETSKLIKTSIEKTSAGEKVNNEVSKQLKLIAGKTKDVTGTLQRTLDEITPLEGKMEHLAQAAHEQSEGVNELAESIHSIDRMSKANLTNSEELGKAAEFLKTQHIGLREALIELGTLTGTAVEKESPMPATKSRTEGKSTTILPKQRHVIGKPTNETMTFN